MGHFITFEGVEGSGKTTQIWRLEKYLASKGWQCRVTREPGGCPICDRIREILLHSDSQKLTALAELLLYEASRAQHVAQIIGPALRDGMVVLCDRFGDATLAYQGYGRCLDLEVIERLNSLASQEITPDLTLLFDCPVELGIGRAFQRISNNESAQKEDRFEQESLDFHRKVREGYLEIARREPERIQVIDASLDASEIHRIVCEVVEARLPYPRA